MSDMARLRRGLPAHGLMCMTLTRALCSVRWLVRASVLQVKDPALCRVFCLKHQALPEVGGLEV